MTTTKKLNPPANISDFDSDSPLSDDWNEKLSNRFESEVQSLIDDVNVQPNQIVFFNLLKAPSGQVSVAHITWGVSPAISIMSKENKRWVSKISNCKKCEVASRFVLQ